MEKWNRKKLISNYIEFFKSKNHKQIPNSSLVPENDPTVLFTTAGMHPLVPFLLGEKHPLGKRLVNVQRCIRTGDIDDVGDTVHHTFFEMLGNWSLGDYFKKEAIEYSLEFLTRVLKIKKENISVSCFAGDETADRDTESEKIWKSLGIKKIKFLGKKDNWWGPAGLTGPCGPDTEMFVNGVEIWNDVFMQYVKDKRLILVDGMYCLYDENFKINKELLETINSFNAHCILVVNKFREKGIKLIKSDSPGQDTNWEAFSLEEKEIKKDNSQYFTELIKKFDLMPEEIIYFDHDEKNVNTAKNLGIISKHYTDINSIRKFIEGNLVAYLPAKQQNVDTGMGVERTLAVLNNLDDNYLTDCFLPIIKEIEKISGKKYGKDEGETRAMRIIADHIKASVFMFNDGVLPANKERGYVMRKLIRRAIKYGKDLGMKELTTKVAKKVFEIYPDYFPKNDKRTWFANRDTQTFILDEIEREEMAFEITLDRGLKKFNEYIKNKSSLSGTEAFLLYQSYGFPLEMIEEEAKKNKVKFNVEDFKETEKKHQELSKTASAGQFKSGLADNSEQVTRLHTAAHMLLAALKKVLGKEVHQKGSNITPERLRFDFNFPRKLTEQELGKVENLVNEQIEKKIPVKKEELTLEQAKKSGAEGVFDDKYKNLEKVFVYSIADFSKEICAGPHVKNTSELGKFRIIKEESSAAGVRRIKAVLT